ncbi:hypothetical protein C2845_PM10G01290 [Panicum miliaceum]|uniref:AAA+ ATPase domain-containing protein n=1 Tax=Panicum miliaceum TaxID=4540 RepID=A0A3L6PFN9_PANMI|nr:hypothetical protein C2845_PM10G01290 [Panicum miliaceum]
MAKRPRHGGAGPSRLPPLGRKLRLYILNGGLAGAGASAEDVADTLRIHHPEFRRQKLDPFIALVRRFLSSIPSPSSSSSGSSASRRRHDAHATTSSSTSVSDEAAHPPPSPAFDFNSSLRSHYAVRAQTPKRNPAANQQQLEIEVTAEKARRLITSDGGAGGDAKPDAAASEGIVRGEKGPRFADLGGMEAVIEELMMEVVVPLCHPELPQRLGVRPVAGLLLHGPPGCGKTTLAHAIANETGVPFYKISAPEVVSGVSDENARKQILKMLTQNLRLEGEFDLFKIARATPGFVGADLKALLDKAGNLAMKRIIDERRAQYCRNHDGNSKHDWWRQPWDAGEVEGLHITMDDFEVFGVNMQAGFLLFGPPGCGKTLIAKAVAHEAGANFIHIKGPELLNKYVGESESEVRKIFTRARTNSPCILFFDELLIELDGADQRQGVYVIGATNGIDVIDDAVLRPGRFGKKHFVPLPGAEERVSILETRARSKPISSDVDLAALAHREECNNLTGADLASLVNEAAMAALEERLEFLDNGTSSMRSSSLIELSHFEGALSKVKPSVSEQQIRHYEALSKRYSSN